MPHIPLKGQLSYVMLVWGIVQGSWWQLVNPSMVFSGDLGLAHGAWARYRIEIALISSYEFFCGSI